MTDFTTAELAIIAEAATATDRDGAMRALEAAFDGRPGTLGAACKIADTLARTGEATLPSGETLIRDIRQTGTVLRSVDP